MDARQKKSREKIITALCELLEEHAFADIAMSAISAKAGISRQTLYTHFATRTAIVEAYMEGWFASIEASFAAAPPPEQSAPGTALAEFLTRVIRQTGPDYHIRRVILSGQAGPEALAKTRKLVTSLLTRRLAPQDKDHPTEIVQLFALFAAFGFTGVTDALGDGTINGSPEEIGEILAGFIQKGLPAAG